jgi:hypothetical protein
MMYNLISKKYSDVNELVEDLLKWNLIIK